MLLLACDFPHPVISHTELAFLSLPQEGMELFLCPLLSPRVKEHPKLFNDSLGVFEVWVMFPALLGWGLPHVGVGDSGVCVSVLDHVTPVSWS